MHRHQLHRLLPFAGLMLSGFKRSLRKKRGYRVGIRRIGQRVGLLLNEAGCRVDQRIKVFQTLAAFSPR